MKWFLATALLAAPLAFAGALQADLVERTNEKGVSKGDKYQYGSSSTVIVEEIVIIWVCGGAGGQTTTMKTMSTANGAMAPAKTHTVVVGGSAGLVYTPETLSADVGDMVIFTFLANNHTLTQSPFATPCQAIAGGIDSGFMPNVNGTVNPPPQMALQVKVSTPLWFFCQQKGHCGKGMVFSINPTANKTQAMFKQMAIAQNGTGSTAGIVQSAPPAAATTLATIQASATTDIAAAAATSAASAAATGGQIATGSGTQGGDGSCSCSCFCGVANFPLAAQGLNGYGGMSGAMPLLMKKA